VRFVAKSGIRCTVSARWQPALCGTVVWVPACAKTTSRRPEEANGFVATIVLPAKAGIQFTGQQRVVPQGVV
jgi:hypothetical protein